MTFPSLLESTPHDTPQVTPHDSTQVTPQVEELLKVVENEMSRFEVQQKLEDHLQYYVF